MATAATRRTLRSPEERALLAAEAIRLREKEGLTLPHIAHRLGVKRSYASLLINDPDGSKEKTRKASYGQPCAECGRQTSGSNGRDKAPGRCIYCVSGRTPPEDEIPRERRRRVPIRLTEISQERRLEAAHEACRIYKDERERRELLLAALFPSNRVYWVAA